jgi:hypothetical protein
MFIGLLGFLLAVPENLQLSHEAAAHHHGRQLLWVPEGVRKAEWEQRLRNFVDLAQQPSA